MNFALDGLKAGFERLKARVGKKLERVRPERQIAVPATMAPAALHYALLGDGDAVADLREMFENLLMSSMDRATANDAHPVRCQMSIGAERVEPTPRDGQTEIAPAARSRSAGLRAGIPTVVARHRSSATQVYDDGAGNMVPDYRRRGPLVRQGYAAGRSW